MKRHTFKVTLLAPEELTHEEVKAYVRQEVASGKGGYDPDSDPQFYIDGESVEVKTFRKVRK